MFICSHIVMAICVIVILREALAYSDQVEEKPATGWLEQASATRSRLKLTMVYLSLVAQVLIYLII